MKRKTNQKRKLTMKDVIKTAHDAGVQVHVGLQSCNMPMRSPNDPPEVAALLDESERVNRLGNDWMNAKHPNPVAADQCFKIGWAHSLSAAWLRCKLKGELNK